MLFPDLESHEHPETEAVAAGAFFGIVFEELFDALIIEDAILPERAGREDIADMAFHFLLHPEVNGNSHAAFGAVQNGVGKASREGTFHDDFFLPTEELTCGWNGEAESDHVLIKERGKWSEIVRGEHALDFWLNKMCSFEALIDQHELVEEAVWFWPFEEGGERSFQLFLLVKAFAKLWREEAGDFLVGAAVGGEVLFFPMARGVGMLREAIPVMKEEVEVFWSSEKRITAFTIEDGGMFLANQGGEFEVRQGNRVTDGFIECDDHVVQSGDEILRANENFVMIFESTEIDDAAGVIEFVGVFFAEVERVGLEGIAMVAGEFSGDAGGVETA